jgi:hypothetical protein
MEKRQVNFFTLNRRLLDHAIWTSEKFTRGQAWCDLIGKANHAPGYIRSNGCRIELRRGDLGWSKTELAKRWKWTRKKVARFFKELEFDGMISEILTHPTTVVSICNYDLYQLGGASGDSLDDPADDSLDDSADDSLTKLIKKNQKEKRGALSDFENYAQSHGHPKSDGEHLYHDLEATGWKRGGGVAKITNWKAEFDRLKARGFLPSQKQKSSVSVCDLAAMYGECN